MVAMATLLSSSIMRLLGYRITTGKPAGTVCLFQVKSRAAAGFVPAWGW
jgi:hypothetical protein